MINYSGHLALLYEMAKYEAEVHWFRLAMHTDADDFTKIRLFKLHLLNILGWNTKMVDKIKIDKDQLIDSAGENYITILNIVYWGLGKEIKDFYQQIDPVEYYDFLLQKIGDPHNVKLTIKEGSIIKEV